MEAYSEFAKLYDGFMEDVPYDEWFEFVKKTLYEDNIINGIICELGAGTGNFTMRLAEVGFDMIGIDNSDDMLNVALHKKDEYEYTEDPVNKVSDIMYLNQDMREFELYGTVRAIVSVFDSINYILEDEEIIQTFKLVNNYLDPKGLFIFDFNTLHKYRDVIGDSTIADSSDEASFIWSNYFDKESNINEYEITFFVASDNENDDSLYRRFDEFHYQRGYTLEEIKGFLAEAGLEFIAAYDAEGFKETSDDSERIFVVARESGK
jgi:hypothetical protein